MSLQGNLVETNVQKFHKTTITVEIITKDEPFERDIFDSALEIAVEHDDLLCAGHINSFTSTEVLGPEAVDILKRCHQNPEWFDLDKNGDALE